MKRLRSVILLVTLAAVGCEPLLSRAAAETIIAASPDEYQRFKVCQDAATHASVKNDIRSSLGGLHYHEIPDILPFSNPILRSRAPFEKDELHEGLSSAIYTFDGNAGCPTTDDYPSSDDAGFVAFSSFFREGVECEAGEGVFRSNAWPETDDRQSGHYIGFSITPHIDASVDLSGRELSFLLRRSVDGPTSVALTYRFRGDDSLYVLDEFGLDDTEEHGYTVALPDTTIEIDIEFHWYAWNASSQGGYLQIDDVRVGFAQGSLGVVENTAFPTALSLVSSYPNPFNPTTTVTLVNSRAQHVTLAAYDVLGRRLAVVYEGVLPPDHHEFRFDASDLAGGVYWMIAQGEAGHDATAVLLSK